MYYKTKQDTYRGLAIKWHNWAATADLTSYEIEGIYKFFYPLARRFGLIREFKEIGIL
jgi:hypothetical protein